MNFKELVNSRYSVRKYSSKPIESEKLKDIIESARKAPSAVNYQPYKIYVIESEEKLAEIYTCYHREWFNGTPLVIAIVGLHNEAWKRSADGKDHADIDVAIAAEHIALQAADLGLGTCWICNFDVLKTSRVLNLSSDEEPIVLIPIGYPVNDNIPEKKRKGVDELVVRL